MDALSISIVGGVFGTLLFAVFRYVAKRGYLLAAVMADMERSRDNIHEVREYIGEFFGTSVAVGSRIEISARFDRTDTTIITTLIAQLAQYAPALLSRVIAFQDQFRKVEVLFLNFLTETTLLKNAETVLSLDDVNYLLTKAARVVAAADVLLATRGCKISDLPNKYPEVIPPVSMHDAILSIYSGGQVPRRVAVFVAGAAAQLRINAPSVKSAPLPKAINEAIPNQSEPSTDDK